MKYRFVQKLVSLEGQGKQFRINSVATQEREENGPVCCRNMNLLAIWRHWRGQSLKSDR